MTPTVHSRGNVSTLCEVISEHSLSWGTKWGYKTEFCTPGTSTYPVHNKINKAFLIVWSWDKLALVVPATCTGTQVALPTYYTWEICIRWFKTTCYIRRNWDSGRRAKATLEEQHAGASKACTGIQHIWHLFSPSLPYPGRPLGLA